jgi:hypothetical protein
MIGRHTKEWSQRNDIMLLRVKSHRAFQLHDETDSIPFGQEGSFFLQEVEYIRAIKYFICNYNLEKALLV